MAKEFREDVDRAWKVVRDHTLPVPALETIGGSIDALPWNLHAYIVGEHLNLVRGAAIELLQEAQIVHTTRILNHAKFVSYINKQWRVFATYELYSARPFWSLDPNVLSEHIPITISTEHAETPEWFSLRYINERISNESREAFWLSCSIE
jgi:hypothetical protein